MERVDEADDRKLNRVLEPKTVRLRPRRKRIEHLAIDVKSLEHDEPATRSELHKVSR